MLYSSSEPASAVKDFGITKRCTSIRLLSKYVEVLWLSSMSTQVLLRIIVQGIIIHDTIKWWQTQWGHKMIAFISQEKCLQEFTDISSTLRIILIKTITMCSYDFVWMFKASPTLIYTKSSPLERSVTRPRVKSRIYGMSSVSDKEFSMYYALQ